MNNIFIEIESERYTYVCFLTYCVYLERELYIVRKDKNKL